MFLGKKIFVPEKFFVSLKKTTFKIMEWGLKGGISIDADSGPPGYVLWCCGGICQENFTFIHIGSGHTVNLLK